jgi:hypothetical protein
MSRISRVAAAKSTAKSAHQQLNDCLSMLQKVNLNNDTKGCFDRMKAIGAKFRHDKLPARPTHVRSPKIEFSVAASQYINVKYAAKTGMTQKQAQRYSSALVHLDTFCQQLTADIEAGENQKGMILLLARESSALMKHLVRILNTERNPADRSLLLTETMRVYARFKYVANTHQKKPKNRSRSRR